MAVGTAVVETLEEETVAAVEDTAAGSFTVGQQSGISKTNAAGINFADKWGKKVDVQEAISLTIAIMQMKPDPDQNHRNKPGSNEREQARKQ